MHRAEGHSQTVVHPAAERAGGTLSRMRGDILCLRLAPGETVSERLLEDLYATSRTPVREALARLVVEGLVQRVGRGYVIAPFDLGEMEDVFDFRAVVEPASIRLAAQNATVAELTVIQRAIDEGFRDFSPDSWMDVGLDFHVQCAQLSRNRCYVETLRTITIRTLRARWLAVRSEEGRRATHEEHTRIVDALMKRDPEAAAEAVSDHIANVRNEVFRSIDAARPILGRRSIVDAPGDG